MLGGVLGGLVVGAGALFVVSGEAADAFPALRGPLEAAQDAASRCMATVGVTVPGSGHRDEQGHLLDPLVVRIRRCSDFFLFFFSFFYLACYLPSLSYPCDGDRLTT